MRILLVDDSSTMRRIQKNQLTQLGHKEIFEADNGDEALRLLRDNMPLDCVLLDWNMPVMDGITCLKRIRANPDYAKVKIIMCTSESDKKKVIEAMREGATNYIIKPFTSEVLREKIGT